MKRMKYPLAIAFNLLAVSLVVAPVCFAQPLQSQDTVQTSITVEKKETGASVNATPAAIPVQASDWETVPLQQQPQAVSPQPVTQPQEHLTSLTAPPTATSPQVGQQQVDMVRLIAVPAYTVLYAKLDQDLKSDEAKQGDPVTATITDNVYLGPYLVIPKESRVSGSVALVNPKTDAEGRRPYLIVAFNNLLRPGEKELIPMSGSIIAYKNGMRGEEYVWRLPAKNDQKHSTRKNMLRGAMSGFFLNPILGPVIGAGASLFRDKLVDKVARGGDVKIEKDKEVPIAIDDNFMVPVAELDIPGLQKPTAVEAQPVVPTTVETPNTSRLIDTNETRLGSLLPDKLK